MLSRIHMYACAHTLAHMCSQYVRRLGLGDDLQLVVGADIDQEAHRAHIGSDRAGRHLHDDQLVWRHDSGYGMKTSG